MSSIKCNECGKEIPANANLCPYCGTAVPQEVAKKPSSEMKPKISAKRLVITTGAAGILLAAAVGIGVRVTDNKIMSNGGTQLSQLRSELSMVTADLNTAQQKLNEVNSQIEAQSKKITPLEEIYNASFAAGKYNVGTDIKPGVYHFIYKVKNSARAYGDYIYVLNPGSQGSNETLGGTKYDFRVEGQNDNDVVSVKLDSGAVVEVQSNYGNWTPGIPSDSAAGSTQPTQ